MYQRPRTRVGNRTRGQTPPTRPEATDLTPSRPAIDDEPVIEVQGVYIISVASRMLDMHPQTLRKYERVGLVTPSRTHGMLRLYSADDIARLRLIKHLVGELRLNLAGVQLALGLFNRLIAMRARMRVMDGKALRSYLDESVDEMLELLHAQLG